MCFIEKIRRGSLFGLMFLAVLLVGSSVCANEKNIKIGIIGPMKFVLGEQMRVAAEMAAEEINAAGGIDVSGEKYNIELVIRDDNSELSLVDALNAFKRLVLVDKVHFVVGGHRSESVLAMQKVMADNKIVFINSGAGHPEIMGRIGKNYDKYKYMFRTQVNNRHLTPYLLFHTVGTAAGALKEQLGITKPRVAIIVEKTIAGDAFTRAAKAVLPKMGMEIVGTWRPSATATDMTGELAAIKAAEPHIIFNFFPGPAGIALSRGWGELQIPACLAGMNGEAARKKHWENTGGMCNYEIISSHIGPVKVSDVTLPFRNKFIEKLVDYPLYNAPLTYDAVFVLKEGIERAGTLDPDAVVKALEKTDHIGAIGRIVFKPKGDKYPHDTILGPGYVTWVGSQWQDGDLVGVSPDGKRMMFGDESWKGVRYEGTKSCKLPPWVVEYWKAKKQ